MLRTSNNLERLHASTLRRYATVAKQLNPAPQDPQLPRYLRRQAKFGPSPSQNPSSSSPKVYRSRHYDPKAEKNKDKSTLKLLDPYTLSSRLKKLCDANQIDSAVQTLKNSPGDAQNTQVWNTIIWGCLKAKRFALSYQLYIDMKRRGFSPSTRTFQTMFTGLSKIENWSTHTKQLGNARSLYDSFQRHMNSVRKHDPTSPELTAKPLASYIKILGDNNLYQEIFDVYHALPDEGQGSAEEFVYTAMFQALASTPTGMNATPIHHQNAADAKVLWNMMKKALKKSPSFQVDVYLVTAAIAALSRGKTSEVDLAFAIVSEYFGLTAPDDPPSKGTIPLSLQSLDAIFKLCNASGRHALCITFLQQVKRRPAEQGGEEILDHGHLNEVLKARLALPGPDTASSCLETIEWMLKKEILGKNGYKLRPNLISYNLAMTACWRDAYWRSATRIFDLMTGYHSHDFMDGSVSSQPRRDARSPGRNLDPPAEILCSLVRTALASRSRANVRQSLRIIDYLQVKKLFLLDDVEVSRVTVKSYFTSKLASAIVDAVKFVSEVESKSPAYHQEMERWKKIANAAAQYEKMMEAEESDFIPTMVKHWPQGEEAKL
ncbi:hypothetical protein C0995_014518 [Termitomyces sp. Mi166|nr:hypothetical protein C0995_014518 [Termitomyces sp. Mi166\